MRASRSAIARVKLFDVGIGSPRMFDSGATKLLVKVAGEILSRWLTAWSTPGFTIVRDFCEKEKQRLPRCNEAAMSESIS